MSSLMTPEGYTSPLTIRETEVAIKEVKDFFERALAKSLHLTRVSAPLFVKPSTGLNDNLSALYPLALKSRMTMWPRSYTPLPNGSATP